MYDRSSSEYRQIPTHLLNKLDAYATAGVSLGHFLTAIVENDLNKAFAHADGDNIHHIAALTKYVYNQLPNDCWGSASIVTAHRNRIADKVRAAKSVV
jgi:hypothetical protein